MKARSGTRVRVLPVSLMITGLESSEARGRLVDLSSHNTNPPGVFDGEAIPISDIADARLEKAVGASGYTAGAAPAAKSASKVRAFAAET